MNQKMLEDKICVGCVLKKVCWDSEAHCSAFDRLNSIVEEIELLHAMKRKIVNPQVQD